MSNAEDAQTQTEKRWLVVISGHPSVAPPCGWCMFAVRMITTDEHHCDKCPVVRVFGDSCTYIPEYAEWERTGETDAARKVYELLIAHRDQLIAAAKEIENEHSERVE